MTRRLVFFALFMIALATIPTSAASCTRESKIVDNCMKACGMRGVAKVSYNECVCDKCVEPRRD